MVNRIKIEVLGSSYTINTEENDEYVLSLAQEVDEQAGLLIEQNPKMSPNDALVLVALSSIDNYHKSDAAADHLRAQIRRYMEESDKARRERDEMKKENDRLRNELAAARGNHA